MRKLYVVTPDPENDAPRVQDEAERIFREEFRLVEANRSLPSPAAEIAAVMEADVVIAAVGFDRDLGCRIAWTCAIDYLKEVHDERFLENLRAEEPEILEEEPEQEE